MYLNMKSKIALAIMLISLAFVFSSSQFLNKSLKYHKIVKHKNQFDFKNHNRINSLERCVKCHDCQNNIPEAQDTIQRSIPLYFDKWSSNIENKAACDTTIEKNLDWNDTLSPDTFKTK